MTAVTSCPTNQQKEQTVTFGQTRSDIRPSFHCSPTATPGFARLPPLPTVQMGTTPIDSDDQQYACKCLNIRIRPVASQTVATEIHADPDFTQVFVGEEGISVVCINQYEAIQLL